MSKIPSLVAWEAVREKGIEVLVTHYPDSPAVAAAVLSGAADIGLADPSRIVQANLQGQDFQVFGIQNAIVDQLVSTTDITSCDQLSGRPVSYDSPTSMTKALMYAYAGECPFEPEWLSIESSEVQAAALLSGELDAASLDFENAYTLTTNHPDRFHILYQFAKEHPGLMGNGFYARRGWLEENADLVVELLKAQIETHRRIADDPQYLADKAYTYLSNSLPEGEEGLEYMQDIVELYVDGNVFGVNGGFDEEGGNETIQLYLVSGDLEEEVPFDQWGTLEYINRALDEVGRL
jgi:ABC-type nitrate/sulfonate/bicarbonate transport system substrate-binding protein